jgi:hypothetical protein
MYTKIYPLQNEVDKVNMIPGRNYLVTIKLTAPFFYNIEKLKQKVEIF